MTYAILRLVHIIGAILISAGLIGVWVSETARAENVPTRSLLRAILEEHGARVER